MQGSTLEDSQISVDYHQETVEHGHHGHPDHRLFGLVLFLVAESSIFLGLFTAFLLYRTMLPVWPPAGTPELESASVAKIPWNRVSEKVRIL